MSLNPLPYQNAIRDFLKAEDGRVWEWFASNKTGDDQAEAVRFDLLKTTYRVERAADSKLYAIADEVAGALSLDVPVIRMGTMKRIKGLEFRAVAMACVESEDAMNNLEKADLRQRCERYVAATRAREHLMVTVNSEHSS